MNTQPTQEQYDYEVSREEWELENPWWVIQCGTAEEARGDYDHDVQRQRELDEQAGEPNKC